MLRETMLKVAVAAGIVLYGLAKVLRPYLTRLKLKLIDTVVNKALDKLTHAAGQRCEIGELTVKQEDGATESFRFFKNAPRNLAELYARALPYEQNEFVVHLDSNSEPGKTHRTSLTFRGALDEAAAVEAALHGLGIRKGDHVALLMSNIPEFPTAFMAVSSMGCVAVTLNAFWDGELIEYGVVDSDSKCLIADEKRLARLGAPALERLVAAGLKVVVVKARKPTGAQFPASCGVRDFRSMVEDHLGGGSGSGSGSGSGYKRASEAAPDDDACIMYTSGTTGARPKGVVLTHQSFCQATWAYMLFADLVSQLKGQSAFRRTDLVTSPLFHAASFASVFLLSFVNNSKMVMIPRWGTKAAIDAIVDEDCTFASLMPTMLCDLLNDDDFARRAPEMKALSNVGTGGASCPSELIKRLREVIPSITQGSGWALTEVNALGTVIAGPEYAEHFLSVGKPHRIVDIKVIDPDTLEELTAPGAEGELCIRCITKMRCYYNKPDATREAFLPGGWVRSGDIGKVDEAGRTYITDRIKEGGENLSSNAVEDVILRYDSKRVVEAAVFGLKDTRLGEQVCAAVCAKNLGKEDAKDLATEVQQFCAANLAKYTVPSQVFVRDAATEPLPRGPTGKILKRELRAQYKSFGDA